MQCTVIAKLELIRVLTNNYQSRLVLSQNEPFVPRARLNVCNVCNTVICNMCNVYNLYSEENNPILPPVVDWILLEEAYNPQPREGGMATSRTVCSSTN